MINLNATIIGQTIAFILFVLFCMKYVWPPIIAVIEKRQKEIADSLSSIEEAKKNLELMQADAMKQLKKAKIEAQNIIEKANKERIQIIKKAKTDIEIEHSKIIAQAKIKIDIEYQRAREELRKEVAMLVILGIEKIIGRSIDSITSNDIINQFINELR